MSQQYQLPPLPENTRGEERRAGFEFEFGNLPIVETARALHKTLGGELDIVSPFEAILSDSALGRLKVERDADALKSVRYRKWLSGLGIEFTPGSLAHEIETNIDSASSGLIPCEVVTDPIPFRQLQKLDELVATMDQLGAEGTQESLVYAFGMHINPSLPDPSSESITRHIQAFLLLHTWIVASSGIDRTRRYLTRYIDPFPEEYVERVLDRNYKPDTEALIDDYMRDNPTRNRALDMLPILSHLDSGRVLDRLKPDERHLVKARPAFHYRLPDCKLNFPDWSVASAWNKWVYIERLAEDRDLLDELIAAWCDSNSRFTFAPNSRWNLRLTSLLSQKFFEYQASAAGGQCTDPASA